MYQAIASIQEAFQKANLKFSVDQVGNNWILRAGVNGSASVYHFLFIKSDETGSDIALRIFNQVKFPPHAIQRGYEVLNDLQLKYRHIRFVLDKDGNVNVEYDFPTAYQPIGDGAVEMLVRLTKVLDECYPVLMRSVWN